MRYWLGADFGQASDFTAVAVLERVPIEVGEREVVRKTGCCVVRRYGFQPTTTSCISGT